MATPEDIQALIRASKEATAASIASTAASNKSADELSEARASVRELMSKINQQYESTKTRFETLEKNVSEIWRHVRGTSKPPPPDMSPSAPLDALIVEAKTAAVTAEQRSSSTSLELAALEGRMIGGFGTLASELKKQSQTMGIGQPWWKFFSKRERRDFTLRALGTIAAIFAAVGTTATACSGKARNEPKSVTSSQN